MAESTERTILALNVGSSSIKFALDRFGRDEERLYSGHIDRIGRAGGRFRVDRGDGHRLADEPTARLDFEAALTYLFAWLRKTTGGDVACAVGHRVVHGGREFSGPVVISPEVTDALRKLIPFAPTHMPAGIAAIEAAGRAFPNVPHVACFDTTFHRTMPDVARRYGLPGDWHDAGLQRYGFHGLSYHGTVDELTRLCGPSSGGRVVIAHLGSGASACAVVGGRSVDTTMGLTPGSGLVMATRCGDIDSAVPLYLSDERGLSTHAIRDLLDRESGLLGVSGTSADIRDLVAEEATDPRAAAALELFCYSARKGIAAMAAAAGGLDTLVFTGGIGTHQPAIRERIAAGLRFLGVQMDTIRNATGAEVVSPDEAAVAVRVIDTNEELVIARLTNTTLRTEAAKPTLDG